MTVQATHGQILVDVLAELQALLADLASTRRSPPPPSFDDEPKLPFDNLSQKGGVHIVHGDRGSFCFGVHRLYLGASLMYFFLFGS